MTPYNVHIYREMRLYFPAITADTPEQAAKIAADKPTAEAGYTEDCEGENLAALIDAAGDDEFTRSVTIDFESERLRKAAAEMLQALKRAETALRDIIGAADNDQPYSREELARLFIDDCDAAHTAIAKAMAEEYDRRPA